MKDCGDRETEWMSCNQQSNLCLRRGTIQPISFETAVRRYRADFELWQHVIKERQEQLIPANFTGISRQLIGCKCVWPGGKSTE